MARASWRRSRRVAPISCTDGAPRLPALASLAKFRMEEAILLLDTLGRRSKQKEKEKGTKTCVTDQRRLREVLVENGYLIDRHKKRWVYRRKTASGRVQVVTASSTPSARCAYRQTQAQLARHNRQAQEDAEAAERNGQSQSGEVVCNVSEDALQVPQEWKQRERKKKNAGREGGGLGGREIPGQNFGEDEGGGESAGAASACRVSLGDVRLGDVGLAVLLRELSGLEEVMERGQQVAGIARSVPPSSTASRLRYV